MSEEIGSLARGWLTAGLPASSFSPSPFTLQPSPPFSQATFHGITHTSFPSDVSLRIDLYTTISSRTFFLFLSAFFPSSSFPSSLSQHFCFQASTRFTPFGIRVYYFCHSNGICCLNFALFFFVPIESSDIILWVFFFRFLLFFWLMKQGITFSSSIERKIFREKSRIIGYNHIGKLFPSLSLPPSSACCFSILFSLHAPLFRLIFFLFNSVS